VFVIKDTELAEKQQLNTPLYDSLKVYSSRSKKYPSKQDQDFTFDLTSDSNLQSFEITPQRGESFNILEKHVHIGFYSNSEIPYFGFAFTFGKKGGARL
jgi:hypothetical protein